MPVENPKACEKITEKGVKESFGYISQMLKMLTDVSKDTLSNNLEVKIKNEIYKVNYDAFEDENHIGGGIYLTPKNPDPKLGTYILDFRGPLPGEISIEIQTEDEKGDQRIRIGSLKTIGDGKPSGIECAGTNSFIKTLFGKIKTSYEAYQQAKPKEKGVNRRKLLDI